MSENFSKFNKMEKGQLKTPQNIYANSRVSKFNESILSMWMKYPLIASLIMQALFFKLYFNILRNFTHIRLILGEILWLTRILSSVDWLKP